MAWIEATVVGGAIFTKKNRGLREVDLLTGSVSIIKRETIEQNGK